MFMLFSFYLYKEQIFFSLYNTKLIFFFKKNINPNQVFA